VQVQDIGISLGELLRSRAPGLEDRTPDETKEGPLVRWEVPNPDALTFDGPRHDIRGGSAQDTNVMPDIDQAGRFLPQYSFRSAFTCDG